MNPALLENLKHCCERYHANVGKEKVAALMLSCVMGYKFIRDEVDSFESRSGVLLADSVTNLVTNLLGEEKARMLVHNRSEEWQIELGFKLPPDMAACEHCRELHMKIWRWFVLMMLRPPSMVPMDSFV